jgi:hypothetical protein
MARKTKTIVIDQEGRDKGKMFVVHEMSATQAEKWAMKAFLALARSGVQIPDNIAEQGFAGIAILGLRALGQMDYDDAEPLLDEMFSMVAYVPDKMQPNVKRGCNGVGPMIEDDIEETYTRLLLLKEMIALHTDFFTNAAP